MRIFSEILRVMGQAIESAGGSLKDGHVTSVSSGELDLVKRHIRLQNKRRLLKISYDLYFHFHSWYYIGEWLYKTVENYRIL